MTQKSARQDGCNSGGGFGTVAFVALPGGGMAPADAAREVWISALCAQVDPELFFPEKGQSQARGLVDGSVQVNGQRASEEQHG